MLLRNKDGLFGQRKIFQEKLEKKVRKYLVIWNLFCIFASDKKPFLLIFKTHEKP
jgi:hypothetical protein